MQVWTIEFAGVEGSRRLRIAIEEQIARLAQRYDAIESCHVVATGPQAGKRPGLFELEIRLTLADGRVLVIGRTRGIKEQYSDIDFAIWDTFRRARRRARDHLRGRSGKAGQRTSGGAARAPGADAILPAAADAQSDTSSAEAPVEATIFPQQAGSPAEPAKTTIAAAVLPDADEPAGEVASPAPALEASGDIAEPALAAEAAAEPSPTAPADAAESEPTEAEPVSNLNPLFVALAVGTAFTAAAALNASATWARLLKGAAEGTGASTGASEDDCDSPHEAGGEQHAGDR